MLFSYVRLLGAEDTDSIYKARELNIPVPKSKNFNL
jgi:hypothetical protein